MRIKSLILILILVVCLCTLFTPGCVTDADVASQNIAKAAEQFEIYRRVVFYNGITDNYILLVEGYCSVETISGKLEVTIKTDDGAFLKHVLGLSHNVTYFAEQLETAKVSDSRYRVIFKPSVIIPNIDIE